MILLQRFLLVGGGLSSFIQINSVKSMSKTQLKCHVSGLSLIQNSVSKTQYHQFRNMIWIHNFKPKSLQLKAQGKQLQSANGTNSGTRNGFLCICAFKTESLTGFSADQSVYCDSICVTQYLFVLKKKLFFIAYSTSFYAI